MRKLALALMIAAILVPMGATESEAKLDPLKYITDQLVRPDVMIVLDTSGSMHWRVTSNWYAGSDCSGHEAAIDVCGDNMCTGHETTGSCSADCQMWGESTVAGNGTKCYQTTSNISRMFIAKRALRNVLPDLRTVANFGLTTFTQTGYHRYFPATGAAVGIKAVYIHEWELRPAGSWTGGAGWDTGNKRPRATFQVPPLPAAGITYTLNGGTAGDSLYRRTSGTGFSYARINWATAGRSYNDGTYNWEYLGSYYTTPTYANTGTAQSPTTYKGPLYVSGGTTYVHNRYGPSYTGYGISYGSSGTVRVPLIDITAQSQADDQVGRVLNWLSDEDNGGLHAIGGTPTGATISAADTHFQTRDTADVHSACRPRFVLVLTDGQSGDNPLPATTSLYNRFPSNPIKTYALALPGMTDTTALAEMDQIADLGDDGDGTNNSSSALTANNEKELVDNIRAVLYGALSGEYTTAASSVSTSAGATVTGDTAIVPSTEFPSWQGHLRSFDLTKLSTAVDYERWEAGSLLMGLTNWYDRKVFTSPATGMDVVPLWDNTGTVDLAAVRAVWSGAPTDDALLTGLIQWLGGKGRTWRLGPFINATPATIGPPPSWPTVPGHDFLEAAQFERQKLVYVASNEGLIHSFCAETGREMFAFVPPVLFPKIFMLYSRGGQNPDPTQFEYLITNSPRVEDLADSKVWHTTLVQTFGGGGESFVALDITNPTTCSDPTNVSTCTTNAVPIKVTFDSAGTAADSYTGDTWSIPALFWKGGEKAQAAMGSGYPATAGEGDYYQFWEEANPVSGWNDSKLGTDQHSSSGAQVDFAVVANGVAIREPDGHRHVLATYQGSLNGKIVRYDKGENGSSVEILDGGTSNPFFFSPAAYHRNDGSEKVTLAAASGAYQANDAFINGSFKTTLYLRSEDGGSVLTGVLNDEFTCSVDQICSAACYLTAPVCLDGFPSDKARPVASPLLLDNKASGLIEAFYLLYDPPSSVCKANKIAIGDSWLIRVSTGASGQNLKEAKKYPDTQVSGLTLVAGGKDIGLSVTGRGTGEKSKVETKSGNVVGSGGSGGSRYIESWREVR